MVKKIFSAMLFAATVVVTPLSAESIVILHTNDTHSNIDPDKNGVGGILQRKAIIDSVRNAEKNVLLVDAGDMVQGSLYFKYFGGDVEYPLFNMMDYDVRILGNHEFDNGLEEMASHWKDVKAERLSANYDFSQTKAKGLFKPYTIRKIGGKKVGFIGLNVNPESLIASSNYEGMKFSDIITTANAAAKELRAKGCDLVVAVTHIGYTSDGGRTNDVDLARASEDIDIIIGGHSHTVVDPSRPDVNPHFIPNRNGKPVLVTQTGKYGRNLGYIKIDDARGNEIPEYKLIPVTDRFSSDKFDKRMAEFLKPYRASVDSVNSRVIAHSRVAMPNDVRTGLYPNWAGDYAAWFGRQVADSLQAVDAGFPQVDLGLINVGGIRQAMPEGAVTEGLVLNTFPFANRLILIQVSGKDLIETLRIVARKGGEGVSREILVVSSPDGEPSEFLIDGTPIDPDKHYVISTIDYVAEGNDDMIPLANHTVLWRDNKELSLRMIDYVESLERLGLDINADPRPRFVTARQ